MANKVLNLAWKVNTRPSEKLVLVYLSDKASGDDLCCWPSLARMELETGLSRRTLIRSIEALTIAGHLETEKRAGRGSIYRLRLGDQDGCHGGTSSVDSDSPNQCHHGTGPVPPWHGTGATVAPDRCHHDTRTYKNLQEPTKNLFAAPSRKALRAQSSAALPPGWVPDLTSAARAAVEGWPRGLFGAELERFKDHAAANGRRQVDWQAAFRVWIANANRWSNRDEKGNAAERTGSLKSIGERVARTYAS